MFNILAVCDDYILGNILSIIKRTMDLLGIIVPILLIIGGTINLVKAVFNPEDKKATKNIVNCFISAVIVFLLPFVVNTTMNIITVANNDNTKIGITENNKTQSFSISECWNNIKTVDITPKFNSVNDNSKNSISTEQKNNVGNTNTKNSGSSGSKGTSGTKTSNTSKTNTSTNAGKAATTVSTNVRSGNYDQVTLIGDSRFVHQSTQDGGHNAKTQYVAESGRGLDYVKEQIAAIKKRDCANCAFVINMGVNDYWKSGIVNEYITYLNNFANSIKGKLYYLSVNPVDEAKEISSNYPFFTSNDSINKFNSQVKSGLNSKITYLDSNAYLKSTGFTTTSEGIHYQPETSQKIYKFITQYVKS